jgi:hypothetical protein
MGALSLDDLTEVAQLSEAQLDASEMAEGARECWRPAEWKLSRNWALPRHLRYLASFTPAQRQVAMSAVGLRLGARHSSAPCLGARACRPADPRRPHGGDHGSARRATWVTRERYRLTTRPT